MTEGGADLRIYLTGGVRIECEGALLDHHAFPWPHAELALAYFVCERNRAIGPEEIADAIWDRVRPAGWEETVALLAHQLRTTLANSPAEACLRLTDGETPELQALDNAWVDVEAAAEAIHDAEGALRAGHPAEAFGPSAVAHHIARRPFLRGETGRWVQSHRDRLRGILLRALECRGEFFLWNREVSLAIEAAKEILALEPFTETGHRLLIRSHMASGNAAEAKRAFDRCRKLFAEQLGIEPSPETRDAYHHPQRSATDATSSKTGPPEGSETGLAFNRSSDFKKELQRLLDNAYDIGQELPAGGMSRVFVAEERALGRRVVVKVLPPDMAELVSAERFTREVRVAAKLQQANIVPVLTAAIAGDLPYYTMPFVPGESLRQALTTGCGLPVARVRSILRDVARALAFAHGQGIVHRDIKPENILLSGDTAVVTDFGIAKALKTAGDERSELRADRLTGTGMTLGTPQYMAPEQIAGDPDIDHRADIYSFGVVAYELLTGRAPFSDRRTRDALVAHLLERPPDLRRIRPDAPASLALTVIQCLEKDPVDRPSSMNAVLAALDR